MSITEIVQSPGYKKLMAYVYGWGAAIVLIGALFKIMHYPGAGPLLVIGMSVEALIFFLSAFEPVHEDDNWSLVYPELIGEKPLQRASGGGGDFQLESVEKLQEFLNKLSVDPSTFKNLNEGLAKLSNTAEKLADLSEASLATEKYVTNMNNASASVGKLSESYTNSANLVTDSSSNFVSQINQSGASVLASYEKVNNSLVADAGNITKNGSAYSKSMESINKNLSSLNASYELQLNQCNSQIDSTKKLFSNVNSVMDSLSGSAEKAQEYKKETEQLNKNLSALNNVYGNMLNAMNVK